MPVQRKKLTFRLLLLLLPFLGGCSGRQLQDAPALVRYDLATLPFAGYWTGILFNGSKVGFSRLQISRDGDGYRLESESVLRLRFLGVDKRVQVRTTDWVGADLSLRAFRYDHHMDSSKRQLEGRVAEGTLTVTRADGSSETLPLDGPLYPMSGSGLYPLLQGLAVGRSYTIPVYDGETETLISMEQAVTAYAESDRFSGPAFRVDGRIHGQSVTTWVNLEGLPLAELSLGGALVAVLEDEAEAQGYLAAAALEKSDLLLDFTLIPANPIVAPHRVTGAELRLIGGAARTPPPDDPIQQCQIVDADWVCRVRPAGGAPAPVEPRYLAPSRAVPSSLPMFGERARAIVGDAADAPEQVQRLVAWLEDNIDKQAVDVFTALDVLEQGRAECQGHSYLYAAFARSLGIPTRIVNGVVYAPEYGGFLYHTWAESQLAGTWVAVDPTFGQLPADATHLKLAEGEGLADLTPMLDLIGRVGIEVIDLQRAGVDVIRE